MKVCAICHKLQSLSEFYRDASYKDGHRNDCKSCHKSIGSARKRAKLVARNEKFPKLCRYCGETIKDIYRRVYCSDGCYRKASDKVRWTKQKSKPEYKEYHRKRMFDWFRRKKDSGK